VSTCESEANLVITRSVEGTSTNVVRQKVKLRCQLPPGHAGAHRDAEHDETWEGRAGERPTLLRHEDE
jgi:hypothetical protein